MKICLSFFFLLLYAGAVFPQNWNNDLKIIERDYSVLFVFSKMADTWNSVDFELLSAEEKDKYMPLVVFAMREYPRGYFRKIGLDKFVIGKNVSFGKTLRAAVPDNNKKIMFLSYVSSYREEYIVHCIHHEINHFAEFYLWGSYRFNWDKWSALFNVKNGSGGESAYSQSNVNWYSFDIKLPGFANKYSTLSQEEDRSEIIGFFLNRKNNEYKFVLDKGKKDKLFFKKCELLFRLYSEKLNFPSPLAAWKNFYTK